MDKRTEIEIYVQGKLKAIVTNQFLTSSVILLVEDDPCVVRDILVLVPNVKYNKFVNRYGIYFVIDDHDNKYPVFTKFRNINWLINDLKSRPAIALWIYQNSLVIRDPCGEFAHLLSNFQQVFQENLLVLIKQKYIEMRTERHNLRQAVLQNRKVAISIIKATVAKLVMEICLLIDNKPYPYKKWLPECARESQLGKMLHPLVEVFIDEHNGKKAVAISEKIIIDMNHFLSKHGMSNDLLDHWWLYLK